MSESAVRTENLARDFEGRVALAGVSLEVQKGRVLALLGPNGAGKTTFLRLLMGHLQPSAGSAYVLGAPARDLPENVCSRIIAMGEGLEPPPWASFTRLAALQADASPNFDLKKALKILSERDFSLDIPYSKLSKGQKHWLMAAITLASGADLLLLDEPADGLDPSARISFFDHLREYVNETEATAVVATHIISDIERVADDVAIIDKGRIVLEGSLEDLREQVKEVEMPAGESLHDTPGLEVLGKHDVGGASLWYVRSPMGSEEFRGLSNRAALRPVNLETLYLVMTEYRKKLIEYRREEEKRCR